MIQNILQNFTYDTFLQLTIIVLSTILLAQLVVWALSAFGKHIAHKTATDFDDEIIDALHAPVFYSIILIGIYTALRVLFFSSALKDFTLPFFQTTLIIMWAVFLVKFIKILFTSLSKTKKVKFITTQTLPLFLNTSFVLIWSLAVYIILSIWGINMTAWLASAGVVGIAVGFAAKDTLANLISGIFIITDAPYKIGDWIVLDGNERGKVTKIGIRTTRIKNTDDMEIIVPNAVIGSAVLKNESGGPAGKKYRLRVPFGFAYGCDLDKVETIVLEIANKNDNVLKEPNPRVRFRTFGASSIDYELLVWVESSSKKGITFHQLNRAIYNEFAKHNIEIPFPKQDIYIKEMPNNQIAEKC